MSLTPEVSLKVGMVVLVDTVSPLGKELHNCLSMDASRSGLGEGAEWTFPDGLFWFPSQAKQLLSFYYLDR